MADKVTKKKRSQIMRAVKNKDTKLEIEFRRILWKAGLRYRKNALSYFGKPDLVLKKYRVVVFIDSCFWHGCREHCRIPVTNKKYWVSKIKRNKERDREVNKYYKELDWKIIRIWEHSIKENIEIETNKIIDLLLLD